jgi:hypothetical protein
MRKTTFSCSGEKERERERDPDLIKTPWERRFHNNVEEL